MSNCLVRIGTEDDISGILGLQSKNLYLNLSTAELADGFVTTPFTPELIGLLLKQAGVLVAESEGEIVAYLLAGDWEFFSQWEIFRVMIGRMSELKFQGGQINVQNSFQYGPICIDRSLRGSGLLAQLFAKMRSSFSPHYPIGVTFINKLNVRSFLAHTKKLKLEIIDEFELNGNSFYTLAFPTVELP